MDIALALNELLAAPVLYRDASSYARLVATWADPRPVPSEADIEAAAATVAARRVVLATIATLEADVTPRRMREAVLTQAGADWLAAKEAEIAAERAKL